MSFFDSLKALFGHKPEPTIKAKSFVNNSTASQPRSRQVYEGRPTETPEWANGLSVSELLLKLKENAKCKYVPLFEMKTIMTTKVGPDGNLVPEYNGVAVSCGAIKQVGLKIAQQNGSGTAYRYCDLNNAYRACCDNPKKCPFYLTASGDNDTINSRRR